MGIREFILFLMVSFHFCHPVEFSAANLLENPEAKGLEEHSKSTSDHGVQIEHHGDFPHDSISAKGTGVVGRHGGTGGTPAGGGGGSEGNGGASNTPNTGAGSAVIPLTGAGAANNHRNHHSGGSCHQSRLGLPALSVLITGSFVAHIAALFGKY